MYTKPAQEKKGFLELEEIMKLDGDFDDEGFYQLKQGGFYDN